MYISVNDEQTMVIAKAIAVPPWRKRFHQYFLTSDFIIRQYDTLDVNSYTKQIYIFLTSIFYILTILNYTMFNV